MDAPTIRYAKTSDGVSIAFWTMGEGPGTPLVMSPPLGWSHIAYELENPELRAWYERLASKRMLVRYDQRNQGLSDRGVERFSDQDQAADIEAVIERLGLGHLHLMGFYGSGKPTLRLASTHADIVGRLVLWSIAVHRSERFVGSRMKAVRALSEADWELFSETVSRTLLGWSGDDAHEWARFMRRAVDQQNADLLFDSFGDDWSHWLERIAVPTLVLQDASSPPEEANDAASIPDARLVRLHQGPPVYRNEEGTRAVEAFLAAADEAGPGAEIPSGTAIILFADIADSTALTERLGDSAFRDKARALDEALRGAITSSGGTAVEGKLLGDGVLAVFTSARDAIACAGACHAAAQTTDLQLHVGIHAGDVIREGGNVFGGAVNIAARVSDASGAGETFVSQTVRDLARTSAGVAFDDRGEHALKGVSETVRLWSVQPGAGDQ